MNKLQMIFYILLGQMAFLASGQAVGLSLSGKVFSVNGRVIKVKLKQTPDKLRKELRYVLRDDEGDYEYAKLISQKSKLIKLRLQAAAEDILWEKGDSVNLVINESAPVFPYKLNLQLGGNSNSRNGFVQGAYDTYSLTTSSDNYNIGISVAKDFASSATIVPRMGVGVVYGLLSRRGAVPQGEIEVRHESLYVVMLVELEWHYHRRLIFVTGVENFALPIFDQVTFRAPTGSAVEKLHGEFEVRLHSNYFGLQYAISDNLSLGLSGYIPPMFLVPLKGRGFNSLRVGISYGF
tara:strand:+ start:197 stop:1075 length:879 start_codon:yes stop_codon:yes gene_type:complete